MNAAVSITPAQSSISRLADSPLTHATSVDHEKQLGQPSYRHLSNTCSPSLVSGIVFSFRLWLIFFKTLERKTYPYPLLADSDPAHVLSLTHRPSLPRGSGGSSQTENPVTLDQSTDRRHRASLLALHSSIFIFNQQPNDRH